MASTVTELLRRRFGGKKEEPIPYQEVEWLESRGYVYIDTGLSGFVDNDVIRWEASIGFNPSYNDRKFVAAIDNPSVAYYCEINVNNAFGDFLGTQSASIYEPALLGDTMYDVYFQISYKVKSEAYVKKNGLWVGNTQTAAQGGVSPASKFVLFSLIGSLYGNGQRIGRNKIYKNGVLIRDFVPCRDGQTPYMYDRVSGELFGKNGHGSLILGNDK